MNVAQLLAALLHLFEDVRLVAYKDTGGVWTIGWGHTAGVKQGDTCTTAQADAWLAEDAAPLLALVKDEPIVAAAAWASFGYDAGYHDLELALAGKLDMRSVIHDRMGHVLSWLVKRRNLEWALIESVTQKSA
jgi:GH24 family phage-related lysozyme (muramidase)